MSVEMFKAGRFWVNLRYLIYAEDCAAGPDVAPPGASHMVASVLPGEKLTFWGEAADELRRRLDEALECIDEAGHGSGPLVVRKPPG